MIRNNKNTISYWTIIWSNSHLTYFLMGFHSNFEGGGRGPLSKISIFDTHTVLRVTIKMYCESFKSISQLLKEEIRCKVWAS